MAPHCKEKLLKWNREIVSVRLFGKERKKYLKGQTKRKRKRKEKKEKRRKCWGKKTKEEKNSQGRKRKEQKPHFQWKLRTCSMEKISGNCEWKCIGKERLKWKLGLRKRQSKEVGWDWKPQRKKEIAWQKRERNGKARTWSASWWHRNVRQSLGMRSLAWHSYFYGMPTCTRVSVARGAPHLFTPDKWSARWF